MLPQFSRSAKLTDVLEKNQPSSTCHTILTPLLKCRVVLLAPLSLATTIPRVSLPCVPQLRYLVDGACCLVTSVKIQLGTAADILFMHLLRKERLLLSDMEGLTSLH
jgi:hypothetical protein